MPKPLTLAERIYVKLMNTEAVSVDFRKIGQDEFIEAIAEVIAFDGMVLSLPDAERLFSLEIMWHQSHPDGKLSKDYQEGFIKGVRHCQNLLRTAEEHMRLKPVEFEHCEHGFTVSCPNGCN